MIKTVIVDDDFLVRSYLKQLHAWENAGYEIVADARDGEEALKAVQEYDPELLVTDISMPLMNGIQLIQKVRDMNRGIYIIVLTCHDDFDYVKEAMKLGANEYVLKNSLNEVSLREMLEDTRRQLKSRKESSEEADEERRLIEMGRNSLKYYFFNALLAGKDSPQEREKKRKDAGICARYMNSAVINMFVPAWDTLKGTVPELELEQYSIRFLQRLTEELKSREDARNHAECVYLGEGVFCCFVDMSELRRNSLMKQRLTSIAMACFRCCREEEYSFEAAVSDICFGEEGVRQAYQQAREVVKNSFYEEMDIIYYEEGLKSEKDLPGEASRILEEAPLYAQRGQYEKLERDFHEIIGVFRKHRTDPRQVRQWLKQLDRKLGIERGQDEYAALIKVEQLMDICRDYRKKLFLEGHRNVPDGVSTSVRMAVSYLHEHYREQIGLSEAAGEAGLNPAYFSFLFKQEMGIGFSAYLLELRMERAKALLRGTNDKIKEVAYQAGFNDYHYFSKAFKKLTGMSPLDYRKQNGGV